MKYPVISIVALFFFESTFSLAQGIDSLQKTPYNELKKEISKQSLPQN